MPYFRFQTLDVACVDHLLKTELVFSTSCKEYYWNFGTNCTSFTECIRKNAYNFFHKIYATFKHVQGCLYMGTGLCGKLIMLFINLS